MVRIEDASQSLSTHVSVYLRSCKVGVAQEFLHSPQIGPAVQQVGRVRVAQGMGVEASRAETTTEFAAQFSDAMQMRGPRLIEAALTACRGLEVDTVFLWPSARSRPLYARHGFVASDEILSQSLRP